MRRLVHESIWILKNGLLALSNLFCFEFVHDHQIFTHFDYIMIMKLQVQYILHLTSDFTTSKLCRSKYIDHKFFRYQRCSLFSSAFLMFICCRQVVSKPLPLITPSHLQPGLILNRLAYPWQGHLKGCLAAEVCHRLAGSSHTLSFYYSSYQICSFFMPFYHSLRRFITYAAFNSFYFAAENYFILPYLSLQMVLDCQGICTSDQEDGQLSSTCYFFIRVYYSFTLFFFSFFYFLFSKISPSLFCFKQDSISFISMPSILNAEINSSISSPFFKPKAFLIPFETALLFLLLSSNTFFFGFLYCIYSSESSTLRLLLSSSDYYQEDKLLFSSIYSLSLTCKPSLPRVQRFTLTSPMYFFNNFVFRSVMLQYIMLGIQSNLKECSQNYMKNPQAHTQIQQNAFTCSTQEQFHKISELHKINGDNRILEVQISQKQQLIAEICFKIKLYYQQKTKQKHLEAKQQKLENDLEELQIFQDKIKKELRLITQEQQIMKGKMIVQHNKITETKEQCNNEAKRRDLLLKHLEEINKGSDTLKKKIKLLKQDLRKTISNKPKIQQASLRAQLNQLMENVQLKQKELADILQKKQELVQPIQFAQLQQRLQALKSQCNQQPKLVERNQQLLKQKQLLSERINFLKGVDVQFIGQKKSLIQKLSQTYAILQNQKNTYQEQLAKYQAQLLNLENQQKQIYTSLKKTRRKRQLKPKQNEQSQSSLEQEAKEKQSEMQERPVNRWKGKMLKRHCFVILTVLGVLGILFGSVASLFI